MRHSGLGRGRCIGLRAETCRTSLFLSRVDGDEVPRQTANAVQDQTSRGDYADDVAGAIALDRHDDQQWNPAFRRLLVPWSEALGGISSDP